MASTYIMNIIGELVSKGIVESHEKADKETDLSQPMVVSRILKSLTSQLLTNKIDRNIIPKLSPDIVEIGKTTAVTMEQQLNYASLLADIISYSVHSVDFMTEVLPTPILSATLLSGIDDIRIRKYLRALRVMLQAGSISSYKQLDYGVLLMFLSKQRVGDSEGQEVRYEALMLLLEALRIPRQYLTYFMCKLFDNNDISRLLLEDICYHKCPGIGKNSVGSFSSNEVSYGEGALADSDVVVFKPFQTSTVHVCGLALPTQRKELSWSSKRMVHTETALRNMRRLAMAVKMNTPVILQGESGSGKSFLIRELAALMGCEDTLLELHLDEQTDSKALIGSYICSDVPGEFVWQPGLITQAVINGRWLVIEDIDRASLEVIATITPLLEKGKILNGVFGEVAAHPSFRIFGTRLTLSGNEDAMNTVQTLPSMRHFTTFWHIINIDIPPIEEVEEILRHRHANMQPAIFSCLLGTYKRLCGYPAVDSSGDTQNVRDVSRQRRKYLLKPFTLRDLIKTADRICSDHRMVVKQNSTGFITEKQRLDCLSDVVDVFLGSMREKGLSYREAVLDIGVGTDGWGWSLSENAIDTHILNRSPSVVSSDGRVCIGRVDIPIMPSEEVASSRSQQFAFSKHSLRLLETVAACVSQAEPVLLVGETGSGKTTVVQELADILNHTLVVQNISLSTDSSDLLGGFRPVSLRQLFQPTYEQFITLFRDTFSQAQNSEYLHHVSQYFQKQQWKKMLKAFSKAASNASKKLGFSPESYQARSAVDTLHQCWLEFVDVIKRLECNLPKILHGFAFAFVDGLLVDAMKKGHWVLLDEVNLATPETLQGLVGILDGQSLCLTEKGDVKPVVRHPDFRIFAAMNPPTDVGKRELPASLRGRFTEIYVEEMVDQQDLQTVVHRYLSCADGSATSGKATGPLSDVVDVYLGCRASAEDSLTDGAGQRPHYSLRSLTRALKACNNFMNMGFRPLSRALYEGFALSFQTQLDHVSSRFMRTFLMQCLQVKDGKSMLMPPSRPGGRKSQASEWTLVKPYWIRSGPRPPVEWTEPDARGIVRFVMTPNVEANIRDLARAVSANVTSVLLQGPTSVGKTTMIEYLAAKCGYRCIRINNHEHTDVQEYIGGYVTSSDGSLVFKDGMLVEALRRGDWIILDELNLAPSDVLEALNRLLDDNRELYIPETGEIVKPSPGFFLFATQNPAGAYGGRKPLSRAFRNRFIEIYISDLPYNEVETIVAATCGIAPKYSKMLVAVMKEMQMRRQQSTLLQGKHGSITTRDLIKWGRRNLHSVDDIVREGYMLLAERHRSDSERNEILDILISICKSSSFDLSGLYALPQGSPDCDSPPEKSCLKELQQLQISLRNHEVKVEGVTGLALTYSITRLWTIVSRCHEFKEPALLVGETGCGKTTVCQLLAASKGQNIRIVNCHQSTETADIIGGLRPVRGRESLLEEVLTGIKRIVHIHCTNDDGLDRQRKGQQDSFAQCRLLIDECRSGERKEHVNETLIGNAVGEVMMLLKQHDSICSSENSSDSRPSKKSKNGESAEIVRSTVVSSCESASSLSNDTVADMKRCVSQWQRYMSLFEWQDGPLVEAMKNGDVFVLDEINLAEDAVIERLNSVLESSRTITLAEKGGQCTDGSELDSNVVITAHPNFRFFATMNPGDDFGKRELSPALRSRFTEVWVPGVNSTEDIVSIVREMLPRLDDIGGTNASAIASLMVDFMQWINEESSKTTMVGIKVSVREVLAWARFITSWKCEAAVDVFIAFVHGAQMLILDGLGIGLSISREQIERLKSNGIDKLVSMCPIQYHQAVSESVIRSSSDITDRHKVAVEKDKFHVGSFSIPMGPNAEKPSSTTYVLEAKSTVLNFQRVLRAMQLPRPILLEGPPGVGKTSLISNLAILTGHNLVRINLSEHSEISDLIGTDLPNSGVDSSESGGEGSSAKFKWCDGVFLTALKKGDWVLLDEMNLAPQSVLEGLNACFDHRGEVYIPEIGKSFACAPSFRVFCAQNPMSEGGGRKGLPQSFLTRLSRVYVEPMTAGDMVQIAEVAYSSKLSTKYSVFIAKMVSFVQKLQEDIAEKNLYGRSGGPWEFNLRDVFRWCDIVYSRATASEYMDNTSLSQYIVADAANMLFVSRMRTLDDRWHVKQAFESVFGYSLDVDMVPLVNVVSSSDWNCSVLIGCENMSYSSTGLSLMNTCSIKVLSSMIMHEHDMPLRGDLLKPLESIATCVNLNIPVLLVGHTGSGKRRCIRHLAHVTGNLTRMVEFAVTPSTDATELLGSFEQANIYRSLYRGMTLLDNLAARLSIVTVSLNLPELNDVVAVLLSRCFEATARVESISENNAIMLHKAKEKNSDNIFNMLNDLIATFHNALALLHSHISSSTVVTSIAINCAEYVEILNEVFAIFDKCWSDCNSQSSAGNFEWVDGVVVTALERGYWLLVENVNLCSASVLDRLNSLLEPSGTLLLTENGEGRIVTPHENFRIFFSMDSTYGEISRAMRNRCVEIALVTSKDEFSDTYRTSHPVGSDGDVASVYAQSELCAIYSEDVWRSLCNVHNELSRYTTSGVGHDIPVYRIFARVCRMFHLNYMSGIPARNALSDAVSGVAPFISDVLTNGNVYTTGKLETTAVGPAERMFALLQCCHGVLPSETVSALVFFLISFSRDTIDMRDTSDWIVQWILAVDQRKSSVLPSVISHLRTNVKDFTKDTPSIDILSELWSMNIVISCRIIRDFAVSAVRRAYSYTYDVVQKRILDCVFQWMCSLLNTSNFVEDIRDCDSTLWIVEYISESKIMDWVVANTSVLSIAYKHTQTDIAIARRAHALFHESTDSAYSVENMRLLKLYISFVEKYHHARCPILCAEQRHTARVKNVVLGFSMAAEDSQSFSSVYSCLYEVAVAAASNSSHLNDCREASVLCAIQQLLLSINDAFKHVCRVVLAVGVSNAQCHIQEFIDSYGDLVIHRDILSRILIDGVADMRRMPWGHITVALRWIQKKLSVMYNHSKALISSHVDDVNAAVKVVCNHCGTMQTIHRRCDAAIASYWRKTVPFDKVRLWKEGGHAALPITLSDWSIRSAISRLLSVTMGRVPLPSFVSPWHEKMVHLVDNQYQTLNNSDSGGFGSVSFNSLRRNPQLMREWLCLFSTFYWSNTNEIPPIESTPAGFVASKQFSKRNRIRVDFDKLLSAIDAKFKSSIEALLGASKVEEIDAGESMYENSVTKSEFDRSVEVSSSQKIDDEIRRNGSFYSTFLAEPEAIRGLICIVELVASINTLTTATSFSSHDSTCALHRQLELKGLYYEFILPLRHHAAYVLSLTLQHTLYDPHLLRELQTLVWFIDSLFKDEKSENSGSEKSSMAWSEESILILNKLSTSFSIMLDIRLHSMLSYNLSNSLNFVEFFWGSKTLEKFKTNPYHQLEDDGSSVHNTESTSLVGCTEMYTTGILRQLQPVSIEVILRLLHTESMRLPLSDNSTMRSLTYHDSSPLTISSYAEARNKLLGMYRMSVHTANSRKACANEFGQLKLLAYYTIVVIRSCRDFIHSEVYEKFQYIVSQIKSSQTVSLEVFEELSALNVQLYTSNVYISKLFADCLPSIFDVLTSSSIVSNPDAHVVDIGLAWTCIGILRVHLSVPVSHVDPAVKSATKAELLSHHTRYISNSYITEKFVCSIKGGASVIPPMHELEYVYVNMERKISRLRDNAIERPDDIPQFTEVFSELREACESLVISDRILNIALSCKKNLEILRSVEWSSTSSMNLANKLMNEFKHLSSEEHAWQESVNGFLSRLDSIFCDYEDITSPITSAFHSISMGLRMVVGWSYAFAEECFTMKSSDAFDTIESAATNLFSIPCTANISLSEASRDIFSTVCDTLTHTNYLSLRATRRLQSARDVDVTQPSPRSINSLAPSFSRIVMLSKIDYYVGCGIVNPMQVYDSFSKILENFAETYRVKEAERKETELRKTALFRYKDSSENSTSSKFGNSDKTFESNDEKEENEALMANFPNHLVMFDDIISGNNDAAEYGDMETDRTDVASAPQESDGLVLDDRCVSTLINLHARMVLVHLPLSLSLRRCIWERSQQENTATVLSTSNSNAAKSIAKDPGVEYRAFHLGITETKEFRNCLRGNLTEHTVSLGKLLAWGIGRAMVSSLEKTLRGLGLVTLSAVAQECNVESNEISGFSSCLRSFADYYATNNQPIDRDLLLLLDSRPGTPWNPQNFHTDGNSSEAIKAAPCVRKMLQAAVNLLVKFPENEFLLNICKISARIAQFSIKEPIGKMLASVQLLLRSAQDWEQYAAKHVSLQEPMQDLTSIITHWRTLELKSWADLLRCREVVFAERARRFWFSLYGVLNSLPELSAKDIPTEPLFSGTTTWKSLYASTPTWFHLQNSTTPDVLSALGGHYNKKTDSSTKRKAAKLKKLYRVSYENEARSSFNESEYLKTVFDTLDGFLRSCVVGEFPTRLHLVRLFSLELMQTSSVSYFSDFDVSTVEDYKKLLKVKLAFVSYGLWQYYSQFLPSIRKFQDLLKSPIEKRLKDEIKISKWDQMNAYAVMEHSERVHRKLNKIIREYEGDVLEYPISAILHKEIMGDFVSEQGELQPSTTVPPHVMIFPTLELPSATPSTSESVSAHLSSSKNADDSVTSEYEDDEGGDTNKTLTSSVPCPVYIELKDYAPTVLLHVSRLTSFNSYASIPTTLPERCHRLYQTQKLFTKVSLYLHDIFVLSSYTKSTGTTIKTENDSTGDSQSNSYYGKLRYGLMAAEVSENMCANIFYRIEVLRSSVDYTPRSVKHRAFGDLLRRLKEEGITHLRSEVPPQVRVPVDVFSVQPLLPVEIAVDLGLSIYSATKRSEDSETFLQSIIDKSESYFYRNICEINQMRSQAAAPISSDISQREVQIMLGQAENMFFSLLKHRTAIGAALHDIHSLLSVKDKLHTLLSMDGLAESCSVIPNQETLRCIWEYRQRAGNLLFSSLAELNELLISAAVVNSEKQVDDSYGLDICMEDDIVQRIPDWQMKSAIDGLNSFLRVLESFVACNLRTSPDECITENAWSSVGINIVGMRRANTLGFVFGVGDVTKLIESSNVLETNRTDMESVFHYLKNILSEDVVDKVVEQYKDFMQEIGNQRKQLDGMLSLCSRGDDSNSTALVNNSAGTLANVVNMCLVSVQELRTLAGRVPAADTKETISQRIDCFGNSVPIPQWSDQKDAFDSGSDVSLTESFRMSSLSFSALKVADVSSSLNSFLNSLSCASSELNSIQGDPAHVLRTLFFNVAPLLDCLTAASRILVQDMLASYKSCGKLLYICLRVFRVLLAKGFCADTTKEGDGGGEGSDDISNMIFEDDVEGTGMGEGDGSKDVSDQIENEEQLLGLKGEKPDTEKDAGDKKLNEEERDQGVEMMQDFDGEMYDLPEEKEDEKKEDDNEDDGEDLDREMGGELDMDNIVDEKQWGDDEDEEDGPQDDETFEKDSKMQGETIDGEMTTKTDEDEPENRDNEASKPDKSTADDGGADENEGPEEENINEEAQQDKPLGVDVQQDPQKDDGEVPDEASDGEGDEGGLGEEDAAQGEQPEGEDLPDNMELGDDQSDGDAEDNGAEPMEIQPENDEEGSGDESPAEDDENDDVSEAEDGPEKSQTLGGSGSMNDPNDAEKPQDEEDDQNDEDAEMDRNPLSNPEHKNAAPVFGVQSMTGKDSVLNAEDEVHDDTGENEAEAEEGIDNTKEPSGGAASSGHGAQSSSNEDESDKQPENPKNSATSGASSAGGQNTEGQGSDKKQKDRRTMEPPNPFRKQGDITEMWHKRLNIESTADEADESNQQRSQDDGMGSYEYERETAEEGESKDSGGMQTLAEASEKDVSQLPQANEDENGEDGAQEMSDEEGENDENDTKEPPSTARSEKRDRERAAAEDNLYDDSDESATKRKRANPTLEDSDDSDVDMLEFPDDKEENQEFNSKEGNMKDDDELYKGGITVQNVDSWMAKNDTEGVGTLVENDDEDGPCDDVEVIENQELLDESRLREAQEQWMRLSAQYQSSSIRLCEQLRLVLEPTLASRLQGDYRTGKRINMRRVIGYVASGFRKDKIWMRRTKPSKREYQVMVMIDDSSSMGQAGPLAMASLSMLSGALTRLEVGDISVCSFAEKLKLLHSFGKPFSDTVGAKVYSQFTFGAKQTRIASALQSVVPIFEESRLSSASSSAGNVTLQICLLISDARIDSDNRENLNRIVREMAEKNILAVLIIIDKNDNAKDSIFATKTVEFTPTGLVTKGYLDDFPFPYYVAIQQVDALPEVLADALKQWFELIRTQLDS